MFIVPYRSKGKSRKLFKVIESFRVGPKVKKRHIFSLGQYPTIERAYQAALKDYLQAADKLERLEYIQSQMQGKRA